MWYLITPSMWIIHPWLVYDQLHHKRTLKTSGLFCWHMHKTRMQTLRSKTNLTSERASLCNPWPICTNILGAGDDTLCGSGARVSNDALSDLISLNIIIVCHNYFKHVTEKSPTEKRSSIKVSVFHQRRLTITVATPGVRRGGLDTKLMKLLSTSVQDNIK